MRLVMARPLPQLALAKRVFIALTMDWALEASEEADEKAFMRDLLLTMTASI